MKNKTRCLKNIFIGFIIILIDIGFTGCQIFFTVPNDADKIPLLTQGDKLIFKSDSTVNYFNVEIAEVCGSYEGESEYRHDIYTTKCVQINTDSAFIFETIIRKDVYCLTIKGTHTFYEDISVHYMSDSLQIGDYLLTNLYKSIESNFRLILDSGIRIIAFKYSLKYGIVEYELSNGETFRLHESCIENMNEIIK